MLPEFCHKVDTQAYDQCIKNRSNGTSNDIEMIHLQIRNVSCTDDTEYIPRFNATGSVQLMEKDFSKRKFTKSRRPLKEGEGNQLTSFFGGKDDLQFYGEKISTKFTPSLFDLDPIFLHPFLILKPSPNKRRQKKTTHFPTANFPKGGSLEVSTQDLCSWIRDACICHLVGLVGFLWFDATANCRCVHFFHFKWCSAIFV